MKRRHNHPPAFADRLFARMAAIYGANKLSVMWRDMVPAGLQPAEHARQTDAVMREVKATWTDALNDFHIDVVAAGLRDLAANGGEWPPALPAFVRICRSEEERMKPRLVALPPPDNTAAADSPARAAFREELARFMGRAVQ